jgi:hypothetical protein
MKDRTIPLPIALVALFLTLPNVGSPLLADPPVRMNIPGTAFSPEGRGQQVTFENVGTGRRFRGTATTVVVTARVPMPPPSSADPKLERLAVHFRSGKSSPSLLSVEVRNGTTVELHRDDNIEGDYTVKETNNVSTIKPPISVSSQSVVRLEIQFHGGFEGAAAGDMVITAVTLDFPHKAAPPPSNPGPVPPQSQPQANTLGDVIYAVTADNELFWYSHSGRKDGSFRWATPAGKKVGSGWNFKQVFSGGDGVIYGITDSGDLMWYRHEGRGDGSFRWAADQAKKVGTGWNFKQVFPGGGGVIYAITDSNELLWYRHDGRNDGSMKWAAPEGKKVGTGWDLKQVFSGGDGVIYGITDAGDLMWYRHEGRGDGSFRWAPDQPKKVGTGWSFNQVFPGVGGVIYAITDSGDLLWYRHDGRKDGSMKWAAPEGKKVGSGWALQKAFCGEILGP